MEELLADYIFICKRCSDGTSEPLFWRILVRRAHATVKRQKFVIFPSEATRP